MQKELEIEFKTLISKKDYQRLIECFNIKNNQFKQINYYFDTPNYDLQKLNKTIRVRQKSDSYILTLKEKIQSGIVNETHIDIDESFLDLIIKDGFSTQQYFSYLNYNVIFVTSLINYRITFKHPFYSGTIFIDQCNYLGYTDYELEYEVSDIFVGEKEWEKILLDLSIQKKKTLSKSQRVFNKIKKLASI